MLAKGECDSQDPLSLLWIPSPKSSLFFLCPSLVQTKCLPPAYLINKSRVKHLTRGWGGSGRAVGDLDNVCQAFLLVGVWFPWLVNFSHEVRRIHSQSHQSWEGFDQPMRRTGSRQESLSSAADRDSPGFQRDKPCGQWPNGIILQHECSQALYNIIQESVIIGLLHACRSSLIFLPAGINKCIAKPFLMNWLVTTIWMMTNHQGIYPEEMTKISVLLFLLKSGFHLLGFIFRERWMSVQNVIQATFVDISVYTKVDTDQLIPIRSLTTKWLKTILC